MNSGKGWLVDGLEQLNFHGLSIQLGIDSNPNWRTHIFQRGWKHQPVEFVEVTRRILMDFEA